MNERDSEFITGLFLERGYKLLNSPENADVVIFNTCSVREHAETRAIQNMAKLMYADRDKIYCMAGCAAQNLKEKLFKHLPGLNIICGTGEIARLPELVKDAQNSKMIALDNIDGHIPELKSDYHRSENRAYVLIMRGCNNFCSYCVVPYVRGRERSRKTEDILHECKNLAKNGIRNITLLGQNVNSYKDGKYDFVGLLKMVNDIGGIKKISFMTSHPKDASTKLLKTIKNMKKLVKHLHLPLQSGSDRILKLMQRGYTAKKYKNLAHKAREIIPDLRLTTDMIVGFPTETEKDFSDTLDLMKEVKFDLAYIFKYSPRSGTKAAETEDDVPEDVKKGRHKILLDLQKDISRKKRDEKSTNPDAD